MTGVASKKRAAAGIRSGRGFLLILSVIVGCAFLLRLGVWAELGAVDGGRNNVYTPPVQSDLATYMKLGREMASGEYTGPFYYQPFYYAVFLPCCYLLSGGSIGFVILVQSLLGAATCALSALSAARLFGKTAGCIAAGFTAVSTPLLLNTPYHQNETIQTFHLALLFYLSLRACECWNLKRWAAVGAVTGIAILTRGNISLLLPWLLAALVWSGRRQKAPPLRIAAAAGLFAATLFLLTLPFSVYNTLVTGKCSGPSTAADAVLALGNSPEAPAGGRDPGLPAGPMEYPEAYRRMMKRAEDGIGVPQQMFEWMCREPAAFFELQFRKLLLFWDWREIPNNVSLYGPGGGAESSLILRWMLPGRSIVLLPFGLMGLLLAGVKAYRRRDVRLWLLVCCVAVYWAGTALFYILSRFRAPILPLVAVAAAGFAAWFRRRWKFAPEQRRRLLLSGSAGTLAAFWLVGSGYECYRNNLEAALARFCRPDGTVVSFGGTPYQLDYGPMTFGGWTEIEMRSGQRLAKRFPKFEKPGEAEWTLFAYSAVRLRFRVNDHMLMREITHPGLVKLRFPVHPENGRFHLEIVEFSGKASLLFDRQRDYGRSELDGARLDGEWLFRLYHSSEPEK